MIRIFQVQFSIVVSYQAIKYFQLTTVTMVQQLSPMCTVVMSYFILNERLGRKQLTVLFLAFGAVSLVILGGTQADKVVYQTNFFAFVMLIMNPIAVALGMIVMRSMRNTPEWTVNSWVNLMLFISMTPIIILTKGFSALNLFAFEFVTIVLLVL